MDIVWSDKFETGNSTIDEQHKYIIEALSGLNASKLPKAELFQLFMDILAYLSVHFETEEQYMKDTNYPEYEIHKANHDKVLEGTKNILTKNAGNNTVSEICSEYVNYVQNWFLDHYSNEDVKMVEYFKNTLYEMN